MEVKIGNAFLELLEGNIIKQDTDAIVNAANLSLLGGGGVSGVIHHAAGPQLLAECRSLGGCETGDAKITKGYNLKAEYVIHTVGPIYHSEGKKAPELLASCYRRSLEVASENKLQSIAFPSISTGAYGYPLEEAAPIALKTVMEYLENHPDFQLVRFVLYGRGSYKAYENALGALLENSDSLGRKINEVDNLSGIQKSGESGKSIMEDSRGKKEFKFYISYDPADHNEAEELYQFLLKNGIGMHCNLKDYDKTEHRKFTSQDIKVIHNCDAFILLISRNSISPNKWVKQLLMYEYSEAINSKRKILFLFLDEEKVFLPALIRRFLALPGFRHLIFPRKGERKINYEAVSKVLREIGCLIIEEIKGNGDKGISEIFMEREYDVFICYKSEDHEYAQIVHDILKSRGLKIFLSKKSLPELGSDEYSKQIDLAIARARHMVVVASAASHVIAKWVEYEWRLFSDEKLAGRKEGNLVIVLAKGLKVADLPPEAIRLRNLEAIPLVPGEIERLWGYVRKESKADETSSSG